ncbi:MULTISPECIES: hypothetical protein [Clostridium]|jgi:hypothetical protein|uniref:hypothetical protein n=1 Tax=Clostridium TaxID=1485 RepID=UPI00242F3B13|nr:hypothetical protein [Clostridium tyrobutyricum]
MRKIKKQIPLDEHNVQRIEDFTSTEMSENFNDKINEVINSYFAMMDYEKIGSTNLLSIDEAMLITDIMRVTKYSCQISPKIFLQEHIKNAYLLNKVNQNYNIDKDQLLNKISNSMSEFQCYLLISLACKANADKIKTKDEAEYNKLVQDIFLIRK